MLIGLTRGTNRAHIARAALEAIAFQSAEVLTLWPRMQHAQCGSFALMGAQQENDLLMQMQADIAGVPVIRPAQTETTALGAAFGWTGVGLLAKCRRKLPHSGGLSGSFEPVMNEDQRGF